MTNSVRPENDIEKLTNHQVILLTFLVAIVTAITSAVAIVRIYQRNPNTVTHVVNKKEVVNNTIEKKPEIKIEKTIIISESDLVAKVFSQVKEFIFPIIQRGENGEEVVSHGFKKNNLVFTNNFDIDKNKKLYKGVFELEKNLAKGDTLVLKDKENAIRELPNEVAPVQLGQAVVNIFNSKSLKKGFVETDLGNGVFVQTINSPKFSMVISLSGKLLGVSVFGKIYPLKYFNE